MTTPLYQQDTNLSITTAHIRQISTDDKGTYILVDKTIFHPQGGGQPSDTGTISWKEGVFQVKKVLTNNGEIFHYGEVKQGKIPVPDEEVTLHINSDWRKLCTQLHSAGHILDIAVARKLPLLGKGGKSYHFPDGPYVEYLNEISDPHQKISLLNEELKQILTEDISTTIEILDSNQAKELGFGRNDDKPVRIIAYGNSKVGCGGTHVKHVNEISEITVVGISSKKGITRIRYEVKS